MCFRCEIIAARKAGDIDRLGALAVIAVEYLNGVLDCANVDEIEAWRFKISEYIFAQEMAPETEQAITITAAVLIEASGETDSQTFH